MSPALAGYVYFDAKFQFNDGETGEKLFIILADSCLSKEYVIVARLTSKKKSEAVEGCYSNIYPPCYFILGSSCNLHQDSWIQFDYVVEYESSILERWSRKTELTLAQTAAVVHCMSQCAHVEKYIIKSCQETLKLLT